MNITAHLKTLLTLAVLAVLLLVGIAWGWSAATSPFPQSAPQLVCYPTTLQPGDRVSAPKVTVSVFNASDRSGLAERTLSEFEDQGFGPGDVGNAPNGVVVHYAQVWAKDPQDPAVRLVLSRLGDGARVSHRHHSGAGIVVMVGAQFQKLVAGKSSVKVTTPTTVCEPPT
jgi:hypothetical protein